MPRTCSDEHFITLVLKHRLTNKNVFQKQHIRPALVNKVIFKLKDINPLYQIIVIEELWAYVSDQTEPELLN